MRLDKIEVKLKTKVSRLWLVSLMCYLQYPLVFLKLITPDQAAKFAVKFVKVKVVVE